MKKFISLLLLSVLIAGFLTGCKKKHGDPPLLPPAESMAIDFSNFESGKKSVDVLQKGVNDYNWAFSALVAGYWRAIIFTTLAVPVTAFNLAVDQDPVWIEEKTWQWNYTATVFTITYKARLVGQIRSADVLWKMYITREGTGGFSEFLWFEGTSDLDGKGGAWTLNHSYAHQDPVLNIVWEGDGTKVNYVKYTYVRDKNDQGVTDTFKNSYIEYGTTTGNFDSYYNIYYYNGDAFSTMNVEWSSADKDGRVKCQAFYSDTNWHCWDENYVDINCP